MVDQVMHLLSSVITNPSRTSPRLPNTTPEFSVGSKPCLLYSSPSNTSKEVPTLIRLSLPSSLPVRRCHKTGSDTLGRKDTVRDQPLCRLEFHFSCFPPHDCRVRWSCDAPLKRCHSWSLVRPFELLRLLYFRYPCLSIVYFFQRKSASLWQIFRTSIWSIPFSTDRHRTAAAACIVRSYKEHWT